MKKKSWRLLSHRERTFIMAYLSHGEDKSYITYYPKQTAKQRTRMAQRIAKKLCMPQDYTGL